MFEPLLLVWVGLNLGFGCDSFVFRALCVCVRYWRSSCRERVPVGKGGRSGKLVQSECFLRVLWVEWSRDQ